jgi:hypothetical protein
MRPLHRGSRLIWGVENHQIGGDSTIVRHIGIHWLPPRRLKVRDSSRRCPQTFLNPKFKLEN